jgi:hypothetical protein
MLHVTSNSGDKLLYELFPEMLEKDINKS